MEYTNYANFNSSCIEQYFEYVTSQVTEIIKNDVNRGYDSKKHKMVVRTAVRDRLGKAEIRPFREEAINRVAELSNSIWNGSETKTVLDNKIQILIENDTILQQKTQILSDRIQQTIFFYPLNMKNARQTPCQII